MVRKRGVKRGRGDVMLMINREWVVTAAHCLCNDRYNMSVVYLCVTALTLFTSWWFTNHKISKLIKQLPLQGQILAIDWFQVYF